MGIVNVTPDSFSGDGLDADVDAAVALARKMESDGADWLDIGGESSRPGAEELDPAEELRRVVPVIEAIRAQTSLPISVDTYHASVAREALRAGADAVNDIWGLRHDPEMARVVAEADAVLIAMHNQRGRAPGFVTRLVREGLNESLRICRASGIAEANIILDPGFGFGWAPEENLRMISDLSELHRLGFPLLVGTSRKSTIGHVLGDVPVEKRLMGTAATVALAIANGADIVRVHDVAEMVQVARMSDAVISRGDKHGAESVFIALGSNLGDRLGNLRAAVDRLGTKARYPNRRKVLGLGNGAGPGRSTSLPERGDPREDDAQHHSICWRPSKKSNTPSGGARNDIGGRAQPTSTCCFTASKPGEPSRPHRAASANPRAELRPRATRRGDQWSASRSRCLRCRRTGTRRFRRSLAVRQPLGPRPRFFTFCVEPNASSRRSFGMSAMCAHGG